MGYFHMCKYALPYTRKTKGSVVNISSAVQIGHREAVPYVTTKGAITAMTRALAIDEANNGVRVNTISPGGMMTPLLLAWCDSLKDKREAEKNKGPASSRSYRRAKGSWSGVLVSGKGRHFLNRHRPESVKWKLDSETNFIKC